MGSLTIAVLQPMAPNYNPLIRANSLVERRSILAAERNPLNNIDSLSKIISSGLGVAEKLYALQYNSQLEQAKADAAKNAQLVSGMAATDVAEGKYTVGKASQSPAEQELGKPQTVSVRLSPEFHQQVTQLTAQVTKKYHAFPEIAKWAQQHLANASDLAQQSAHLAIWNREYHALMAAGTDNLDSALAQSITQGSPTYWKSQLGTMKGWLSPPDYQTLQAEYEKKYNAGVTENQYRALMYSSGPEAMVKSVQASGMPQQQAHSVEASLMNEYSLTRKASAIQMETTVTEMQRAGKSPSDIKQAVASENIPQVFKQPVLDHLSLLDEMGAPLKFVGAGQYEQAKAALDGLTLTDAQRSEATGMLAQAQTQHEATSKATAEQVFTRAVELATVSGGGLSPSEAIHLEAQIPKYSGSATITHQIYELIPKGGPKKHVISAADELKGFKLAEDTTLTGPQKRAEFLKLFQTNSAFDPAVWNSRIVDNSTALSDITKQVTSLSEGPNASLTKVEAVGVVAQVHEAARKNPQFTAKQLNDAAEAMVARIDDKKFQEAVKNHFSWNNIFGTHPYTQQMQEVETQIGKGDFTPLLKNEQAQTTLHSLALEQAREFADKYHKAIASTQFLKSGQPVIVTTDGEKYIETVGPDGSLGWHKLTAGGVWESIK